MYSVAKPYLNMCWGVVQCCYRLAGALCSVCMLCSVVIDLLGSCVLLLKTCLGVIG